MGQLLGPDGKPVRKTGNKERLGTVVQFGNGYLAPWPEAHMTPHGFLMDTMAGAALWKFFGDATLALATVPTTQVLSDESDVEVNLHGIARGCAVLYGVTIQEMFASENLRRGYAQAELVRRGIDPFIKSFIATGGENNNTIGRDSSGDVE